MKRKYITKTSDDYSLLDNHTGEVLKYSQVRKVSLEDFIMIFFSSIPELAKLTGQKLKVLMVCWMYADYGNSERESEVINDATFKDAVRRYEPMLSDSNIDACFSDFVKGGILRRICRGRYALNHNYFFRGKLSDRSKLAYKVVVDPKDIKKTKDGSCYCFFTKSVEIVNIDDEGVDLPRLSEE